ncbi:MAG TPA: tetratricopeptide repeat protein [Anaerolineales bacterium]|nr:tetratricopeptide repeat protein [Anaerolineales bacterium]
MDAKQFPAVVFWSFYEGDASFENFLKETLKYLGVLNAEQLNPREQTEILLNLLQRPGLLLILDGFERVLRAYSNMGAAYQGDELQTDQDDSQDRGRDCVNIFADAFLRGIGAFGFMMRSKVLMTTRLTPRAVERYGQFLQGVREEELREMKKEDAVAFFHAQGVRGTHAEIEAACEPYGNHPLSLRILAGMIVNDRNAPGDISAAKNFEITGDIIQNKHHVLETAFNSLSAPQKSLLGQIACLRTAMTYDTLKTLHRDGKGNIILDEMLKILESRGLLHWDRKANKYDLHPIVRRFAYDRLTASDRTAAHTRLVNYFEATPKLEKVKTLEDLAPVIELYHHMVRAGNLDEAKKIFKDRLDTPMYYQFGAYQLQIELLRSLFPDGEDKPPRLKTEADQALILNDLAAVYALSGYPSRAVRLYLASNELDEKSSNKQGVAIGLGNAAGNQLVIGALSAAERNLRRQVDLFREIADEHGEAIGHRELGSVLSTLGSWEPAEQEAHAAIEMFEKQNNFQSGGYAWACFALYYLLISRADFQSRSANIKSAIECASRALELADKQAKDIPVPRDYVRAYWLLGAAYRANNDLTLAEENLSKALNQCRQINMVDHEANILLDLARLRYAQGDFKEAQEKASEALVITQRSGYVLQGADVNLFLAQYALEQEKDKTKAKEYAKTALKLATCDGPPYYYKVAYEEAERLLEKLK